MVQFVNMFPVDLANGPALKTLNQMHSANVKANRVGAIVTNNGAPVTLSGTCSGTAILADHTTVAMTGAISGNQAYVELASACYTVEGPIHVFVTCTDANGTTTLVAASGYVRLTETDTVIDPGTIIPSVAELIQAIEDAVDSVPADYTTLLGSIAHTFSSSASYTAGKYVWYNGELYRFNIDHPAGAWIGTDAARYTATDELPLIQQALGTKADAAEVAELKSAIFNNNGVTSAYLDGIQPQISWFQGTIKLSDGTNNTASNRIRCNSITVKGLILVRVPSGIKVSIRIYQEDGTYISGDDFSTEDFYLNFSATRKIRLVLGNTDDSDISPSDGSDIVYTYLPDASLTKRGVSADAKATGDKLIQISEPSYNLFSISKIPNNTYGVTVTENDDQTVTFNGTATLSFMIYLMGANNENDVNVEANKPYVFDRTLISGSYEQTNPYFAYTDDDHDGFTAINKNRVNTFSGNPRVVVRVAKGSSYTNAKYRFSVVQADENLPYVENGANIAVDPIARTAVKHNKTKIDGKHTFFTVNVKRPRPFGGESYQSTTQEIECALALPSRYMSYGTPTRLVLTCHGSGGYIDAANEYWWHSKWNTFISDLTNAGYACFDCNLLPIIDGNISGVGEHYGSPLYIDNCKKAYDYIVANYNVYPEIFVHGCSMGGVGATGFAHVYPQIVLAESSFAGRDICLYLRRATDGTWDASDKLQFANACGYDTWEDAITDKLSHIIGYYPSLSLVKVNADGSVGLPPDRETALTNWMEWFGALESYTQEADAGSYMGQRKKPYKAWNSWGDRVGDTKFETILTRAYNTGGSCVCYNKLYDNYSHSQMCYGQVDNMSAQLVEWYKQWE